MIEKNTQQVLKYKPGDVVTLTVARLGEMGAFLDAGTGNTSDDILLHKLQQTEEIKEGDKVKVSIRFRGREMGHPEIGYDTMKRFAEACSEVANIEKPAKLEGRNMLMFLAPKSLKQ